MNDNTDNTDYHYFLLNAQPGQKVGIVSYVKGRARIYGPYEIDRVLPTRIVLPGGKWFVRRTGFQGGGYGGTGPRLQQWTEETAAAKARVERVDKAERFLQRVARSADSARGEAALRLYNRFPPDLQAYFEGRETKE